MLLTQSSEKWTTKNRRLRKLLGDESQFDLFEFPPLQNAYLGISRMPFNDALLLKSRWSIDKVDVLGRIILSWPAQKGDSEAVSRLVACGADPNRPDYFGQRPLHWSWYAKNCLSMRTLLDIKADVNWKDMWRMTVLHAALVDGEGDIHIYMILFAGIDVNQ